MICPASHSYHQLVNKTWQIILILIYRKHNLQSQKSEVHDDAGLWQIHIWPPNLRGDPSVILCHLHEAKPRRSMLWWKIAILPTLHPVEISLRSQETNMHHDARYNFKHLLSHLHNSYRLHFSHAISVTILPTHRNNLCGRKIIIVVIKDRDLGWGEECGKVIFVPKLLSHHPTHCPWATQWMSRII